MHILSVDLDMKKNLPPLYY